MISLSQITVRPGRAVALVSLSPDCPRRCSGALAQEAARLFPDLPRHACVNAVGPTFGCVMEGTSVPHLLEHMVIDLQLAALAHQGMQRNVVLAGNTRWVNKQEGTARVEVAFVDDIAAVRAFDDALKVLNKMLTYTC